MGKKGSSAVDLNDIVRELGGNDEDLKLVADADFSGSDYEDSGSKPTDSQLADDVNKMWKELNFSTEDVKSGPKKKSSKENEPEVKNKPANGTEKPVTKKTEQKKPQETTTKISKTATTKSDSRVKPSEKPTEMRSEGVTRHDSRVKPLGNSEATRSDSRKQPEKPVERKTTKSDSRPKPEIKSTSVSQQKPAPPTFISKKDRLAWDQYMSTLTHPKTLVIKDDMQWADMQGEPVTDLLPTEFAETLKRKAQELLDAENQVFFKERMGDREFSTSLEFLKSGTFSDQLGTLSILSTESPLHSVRFLETLASKCEIKNRESACKALEVTKDLLVSHVLPDRRLRYFKDQPLKIGTPMATLISWSFEDFLKRYFFRILTVMESLLADTVENIRTRTLHCIFAFFQQKPEQEANLLRLSLNKLGDPAGKVASRVKRLLMDVLQMHPGMKPVVATAMAELLGRVHDYRTRYYAVDTMSEFILSSRDPGLANQLIYIYLGLFERLLNETKNKNETRTEKPVSNGKPKNGKRMRVKRGKKGGVQQTQMDANDVEAQQHARLVAKIFTGLNRAFPFSNLDAKVFEKYTDTLYHMSHSPNVGTFIEALSFIFQLSKAAQSEAGKDRYYRALYESLLDTRLSHSSKISKYMHLLLKSLAELRLDGNVACSNAFSKRALQVACNISEVGAVASLIHVGSLAPFSNRLIERDESSEEQNAVDEYDTKKRDPRYAKAETSYAWEALLLQQHFHPTVALYANNYLAVDSEKLALDMPDIEQYSVSSFLSKWSYKKPKAKESNRGGSIFQPLAGFTDLTLGIRQQKKSDDTPASMQDWKNKKSGDIAPEERFLYEYFSQKPEKKTKKQDDNADKQGDEDADSDAESIAEDEINEAMSRSGPGDLGGADINPSDMDEDSEEDGDLEADLANAFRSDEDDVDLDDEDLGSSDNDQADAGLDDDFANFDGVEDSDQPEEDEKTEDGKKRKRGWTKYPTFLDVDAFEEMYGNGEDVTEKAQKKKRR